MEQQICSPLSVHKTIAKTKPKIRIIHIFAPEIIKTDAENFRELVQRLTGKPTDDKNNSSSSFKKRPAMARATRKTEPRLFPCSSKKIELAMREKIKGEEDIWRGPELGEGFLGAFADQLDGFMQGMNHFPGLEGTHSTSCCQMDDYGFMPQFS